MPKSPYIEKLCQMFEIFISSQLSISIYIPEIKNLLRRAFKIDKATIFFLYQSRIIPENLNSIESIVSEHLGNKQEINRMSS